MVCKVLVNDDARVPDDVVVSVGVEPCVRSWTCPVVVLKRTGVPIPGDEDQFPPADGGPAHPFPPPPPRWMRMDGPNAQDHAAADSAASHSAHGPSRDADMTDVVDDGSQANAAEFQANAGVVNVNPESNAVVIPDAPVNAEVNAPVNQLSVIAQPTVPVQSIQVNNLIFSTSMIYRARPFSSFRHISCFFCDLDSTLTPRFLYDDSLLSYLASIAADPREQVARPTSLVGPMPLQGRLVLYPDTDDNEDDEVVEIPKPLGASSSRKRRRLVVRGVSLLRRSACLNQAQCFKNNESAEAATLNPSTFTASAVDADVVAPHLPLDLIQSVATGYLQIQPEAVSAAALLELDDDSASPDV